MNHAEFASAFLVKKNSREAKISLTVWQFDIEESFQSSPARFRPLEWSCHLRERLNERVRGDDSGWTLEELMRLDQAPCSTRVSKTFSRENRVSFKFEKLRVCLVIACCELWQKNSRKFDSKWILLTRIFVRIFSVFLPEIACIFQSSTCTFRNFFACFALPYSWCTLVSRVLSQRLPIFEIGSCFLVSLRPSRLPLEIQPRLMRSSIVSLVPSRKCRVAHTLKNERSDIGEWLPIESVKGLVERQLWQFPPISTRSRNGISRYLNLNLLLCDY